jgi:hypothetical protein
MKKHFDIFNSFLHILWRDFSTTRLGVEFATTSLNPIQNKKT